MPGATPFPEEPEQVSEQQRVGELDLYGQVLEPAEVDDLFQRVNLGTGNYTDAESWQQVQAYRDHLFAAAAFASQLDKYAIRQTIWALGEQAMAESPEERAESIPDDIQSRRERVVELGKQRWDNLGRQSVDDEIWKGLNPEEREVYTARAQQDALREHAGVDSRWTDPFGKMIAARHESSRSRGARLIDNLFSRVREFIGDENEVEEEVQKLGGGLQ